MMYTMKNISVADTRLHLSEILGKVAYGGEAFVITKKGRPMAHLTPVVIPKRPAKKAKSLGEIKGWLADDDPCFAALESIREENRRETPFNPFGTKKRKK